MTPKIDLVNVRVSINGKEQTIKMEKGTSFENKGGIFTAGESKGILKMTNYQLQTFKAMANNYVEEGENGIVLSKKDIEFAQQKYRNGDFVTDMSELLPEGYKIERPKLTSAENMVQAYVTNGKESQSATLKFSFIDKLLNNKQSQSSTARATKVSEEDLKSLGAIDGKFNIEDCGNYTLSCENLPIPVTNSRSGEGEDFVKILNKYNGLEVTPDNLDSLINELLDGIIKGDFSCGYDNAYSTISYIHDVARFAEYLKPSTIDKLFSVKNEEQLITISGNSLYEEDRKIEYNNVKALYERCNNTQKEKFYDCLLTVDANRTKFIAHDDYQIDGTLLASLIFEPTISDKMYEKVKNLVIDLNKPNGIKETKTECKNLVDTLLERNQITQAQQQELYKTIGL